MNLWQGANVTPIEFKKLLVKYIDDQSIWCQLPLNHEILFRALLKMTTELQSKSPIYQDLIEDLRMRNDMSAEEIHLSLSSLIDFINIDSLRLKLKREFQTEYPFEFKRPSMREEHFESWIPLGVLVHVTPNNSPLLGVFAMLEGLLSGNVNVLKLSRKDSAFASLFFHHLIKLDETDTLKKYIFIGGISSKDKKSLTDLFSIADVVSAWGSEEGVKGIRELVPMHTKFIVWGHKISFAYISQSQIETNDVYEKLASEICNNEQQACSSPQCVFVEDSDFALLKKVGQKLSNALLKVAPTIKRAPMDEAQKAELTIMTEQVRLESVFENAEVITDSKNSWRIYLDMNEGLSASPLYRTIWLRPLHKKNILSALRPFRQYLQTLGLAATGLESQELMQLFYQAGVQRICPLGKMTESYVGEPHDGIFALRSFCQKISYTDDGRMRKMASLMLYPQLSTKTDEKIMTKVDFQNQKVEEAYSQLFFHSGGSSGEPKLSIFSYDDYHRQMDVAAEGLFAAGLDPKKDRCMNLFYGGNLYGGFVSFFTILEKMEAIHFPMAASTDFELVVDTIVKNKVTTLLGMPSYIMQVFSHGNEKLKKYAGVKKIFFGGEHFSEAQQSYLKKNFKIEFIRSASYGSVDAGPLGFQCEHCVGSVHHLHERLHSLEVVDLFEDTPVKTGEVGRFLFTSKVRHGQKISRYEIGDVGRILDGTCSCGRSGIRFELLGRCGDVFRIGTIFLSYQKFQKLLSDKLVFSGAFQLHLYGATENKKEKIVLFMEDRSENTERDQDIRQMLIDNYPDLFEVVVKDLVLDFEVHIKKLDELEHNPKTGKLRSVIDHRFNIKTREK